MPPVEFIAPTKRRKMTKARAARIFLSRNGVCFTCRRQIRQGEAWFVEHPNPLAQGGSDDDSDLWPAHTACKAGKDAIDAKAKAKRDRLVTAGLDRGEVPKLKGRGFRQTKPQRKASKPIEPKFPGDILARQRRDA